MKVTLLILTYIIATTLATVSAEKARRKTSYLRYVKDCLTCDNVYSSLSGDATVDDCLGACTESFLPVMGTSK
jgi:hypothetical protein